MPIKLLQRGIDLLVIVSLMVGCTISERHPSAILPAEDPCTGQREKAKKFIWERRYEKALEILHEPSFQCRGTTESLLMEGDIFYTLEDWDKAERIYNRVRRMEPRNPMAVVRIWFIRAMRMGFTEPAQQELINSALTYLEEDPEDPGVLYAVLLGLEGAGAIPEKTEVIEKYVQLIENPAWREDVAELYLYDTLRVQKEKVPQRARFFMKTFPTSPYRYHMAHFLLSAAVEKGKTAVNRETREILEKEPDNRILNYLCARAIVDAQGDLSCAKSCMEKAIEAARNPDPSDR